MIYHTINYQVFWKFLMCLTNCLCSLYMQHCVNVGSFSLQHYQSPHEYFHVLSVFSTFAEGKCFWSTFIATHQHSVSIPKPNNITIEHRTRMCSVISFDVYAYTPDPEQFILKLKPESMQSVMVMGCQQRRSKIYYNKTFQYVSIWRVQSGSVHYSSNKW